MHSDYKDRIELLLYALYSAYETFNYDKLRSCYIFPCQLNWAGSTSMLADTSSLNSQFDLVWSSLRAADFQRFKSDRASVQTLSENQALACTRWSMLNSKKQVIKNGSTIHFLTFGNSGWKISCEVVHNASKYITLSEKLILK